MIVMVIRYVSKREIKFWNITESIEHNFGKPQPYIRLKIIVFN